jgi:2-keto-3-deoxy-L-rhamnonate aldolase RhmA
MLESPKAIENVDSIASVPGVDVVLIGTNDLCMEMGIPGDYANPKIKEAYKKVIETCKIHGKTPGMGGVYNEELMSEYIDMGMKFILSGSDLSFMMSSALQRSKKLRSFQKK